MAQGLLDIKHLNELATEITSDDIAKLRFYMKVPSGVCDKDSDVVRFLFSLQTWKEFNPYLFYQALTSMDRHDLLAIASNITWLCVSEAT